MNFAVNQALYDGDTPIEMCRHKGEEHAAYGWASNPRGHWGTEQRKAYMQGYLGLSGSPEPLDPCSNTAVTLGKGGATDGT